MFLFLFLPEIFCRVIFGGEMPLETLSSYSPYYTEYLKSDFFRHAFWVFEEFLRKASIKQTIADITMGFTVLGNMTRVPQKWMERNKDKLDLINELVNQTYGNLRFMMYVRTNDEFNESLLRYLNSSQNAFNRLEEFFSANIRRIRPVYFYLHQPNGKYYLWKNQYDDYCYFNLQIAAVFLNTFSLEMFFVILN